MARGRVVLTGHPVELIGKLEGRIWKKVVSVEELREIERNLVLIAVRRFAGRRLVHVYGEERPGEGFEPADPDLEDVYFHALVPKKTGTS